jgi:hypothetical protein
MKVYIRFDERIDSAKKFYKPAFIGVNFKNSQNKKVNKWLFTLNIGIALSFLLN